MNRIELIKRWLLAQIQPELFYIPWNNNATKHNVYIYSHIYHISEKYPDIETCKEQGVKPIVDYGFLIFDSKGKIVSYNSFCVPLKKGKYCAIHWTCLTGDLPSYSRKYVFFEVKDSDVYIFVEETTRSYIFEVHYEEKTYTETYVRNYVLQQYPPYGTRYLDLFEYNGGEVENTSLSPETIDSDKIPYHQLIANSYIGVNRYAKNSVKEYNTIEKYREITTENKNGYRIYFSIKEKNNNFNCERYDINLTTVSEYNQKIIERWYDLNPDEGYIYDYRYIAADRTWIIRDGLYTNKKGNIVAKKKNNFDDRYYARFGDTDLYLTAYHCFDWNYNSTILRTHHRGDSNVDIPSYDYVKNYNFFKSPLKEWLPEIIDDTWVGDEYHVSYYEFNNPILNEDKYQYLLYSNEYDKHEIVPVDIINNLIIQSIPLFKSVLPDDETTPSYFNPEIMDYIYKDEDGLTLSEYSLGMREIYENANASLSRYLFILGKDFNKYGYSLNPNGIYTLNNSWIIMPCYSQIGQLDEYKKTYCVIHYTPVVDYYRTNPQTQKSERVLMILTPKEITEYFKNLMYTQEKLLQDNRWFYTYTRLDVDYVDNKNVVHYGNRIIINYKEIDITDDEYQEYQSQTDYSEKMEQIISEQNRIKNHISHLQKEFIQRYKEEYKEIPITSIPER